MIFRWRNWIQSSRLEAENIPGRLPNISNMCIQKQGILKMRHQGQIYIHTRGNIGASWNVDVGNETYTSCGSVKSC